MLRFGTGAVYRGAGWVVALALAMGTGGAASAVESLGTAVGVRPLATGQLGDSRTTIIPGSELFEGQVLATGPDGEIQIVFTDNTHMVIGPSSTLEIERYLMTGAGTLGSLAVNALSGTFRFITGGGPHDAYSISTPAGTIGIRGTQFDFSYDPRSDRMNVVLYFGAVTLCSASGDCVDIDRPCEVGTVGQSRRAESAAERERVSTIQSNFPYATPQTQGRLREDFRVDDPGRCLVEVTSGVVPQPVLPPAQPPQPAADPPPVPPPQPPPGSVPSAPPPPAPEPPPVGGHANNGIGNGGEGNEGPAELGNPGRANNQNGGGDSAGGGNPNAGGGNPNAGGGNPNAGGGNPNAGGGNPNAGGGNPNAGGGNPNAAG